MNVTLKPEHEQFIQAQLASGRYTDVDEIISQAFKLLQETQSYEQWVEQTREKVAVGIEQLDRGEGLDYELVMARLQEKIRHAEEA